MYKKIVYGVLFTSISFLFTNCGTGVPGGVVQSGDNGGGNSTSSSSNSGGPTIKLGNGIYVTDGPVSAMAATDSTAYLGGNFTSIGRFTGGLSILDRVSGLIPSSATLATIDGPVYAAVPAADGGFYIGGSFSHVGGVSHPNLAKLFSNGAVDNSFNASTDNYVYALALGGSTLYVGGLFSQLDSTSLTFVGAVDASSGALVSWSPVISGGPVNALAVSGNTIFVGGSFTSVNAQSQNSLAAVDTSGALVSGWDATIHTGYVNALAVDGADLYVGGTMTSVAGTNVTGLLSVKVSTGVLNAGFLPFLGETTTLASIFPGLPPTIIPGTAKVNALAIHEGKVYFGGDFETVGGVTHTNAAAVSQTDGSVASWSAEADGLVHALAIDGSSVYLGGEFTHLAGTARLHAGAVDTSGSLESWDPRAGNQVTALAIGSSNILAGGSFVTMNVATRSNLAAIDLVSGQATSWSPVADGVVGALALNANHIYIGGNFQHIDGSGRKYAAAFDLASGSLNSWNPAPDNSVSTLVATSDKVYLGGSFANIVGTARAAIARVDSENALLDGWNPQITGQTIMMGSIVMMVTPPVVNTLLLNGSRLYIGGNYYAVGGDTHFNGLAAVTTTNGVIADGWSTVSSGNVRSMTLLSSTLYLGGDMSPSPLLAVDSSSGVQQSWNPAPSGIMIIPGFTLPGSISFVTNDGTSIFAAGLFSTIGGRGITNFAKLDATTGSADGTFAPTPQGSASCALLIDGKLLFGGSFGSLFGSPVGGMLIVNSDGSITP